jgi:hypothetical protein
MVVMVAMVTILANVGRLWGTTRLVAVASPRDHRVTAVGTTIGDIVGSQDRYVGFGGSGQRSVI